jgi:hypothetical protein
VTFDVLDGKTLDPFGSWLREMTIGTTKIDVTQCALSNRLFRK